MELDVSGVIVADGPTGKASAGDGLICGVIFSGMRPFCTLFETRIGWTEGCPECVVMVGGPACWEHDECEDDAEEMKY